jgi:hypothetical protein
MLTMHSLNDFAPAIGGAAIFAYGWWVIFRIKRQQAKARETKAAE